MAIFLFKNLNIGMPSYSLSCVPSVVNVEQYIYAEPVYI